MHKAFLRAFRVIDLVSNLVLNLQLIILILGSSILQKKLSRHLSAIVRCVRWRQSSNNFSFCYFTTDFKRKILNQLKSIHPAMKNRDMIATYTPSLLGQFTLKLVCPVISNFIQEPNMQY